MSAKTHLINSPLDNAAIGVRHLQPHIIVCIVVRLVIALPVLPRKHRADDKHQERAYEVADAYDGPGYVVPAL